MSALHRCDLSCMLLLNVQVNRKDSTGKNWVPRPHSRVCSKHFVDGSPTTTNPYPTLELGYNTQPRRVRRPPTERQHVTPKRLRSTTNLTPETQPASAASCGTDNLANSILSEHCYAKATDCLQNVDSTCISCAEKDKVITQLRSTVKMLERKLCRSVFKAKKCAAPESDVCEKFVKTDKLVKQNTGLRSVHMLDSVCQLLHPRAATMRYWVGSKRAHRKRKFRATPKKSGVGRRLTVKSELVLVLMKIRLALPNEFLAGLFGISVASCSSIINTWLRFLAKEFKPLVFWPEKESVRTMIPASLKVKYPNLRCTIDCSETFIQRPRDLFLQATTWSDYKHHNTLKYLVAITPDGHISFISHAWGGRATD